MRLKISVIAIVIATACLAISTYAAAERTVTRDYGRMKHDLDQLKRRAAEEYEHAKRLEEQLYNEEYESEYHPGVFRKTANFFSNIPGLGWMSSKPYEEPEHEEEERSYSSYLPSLSSLKPSMPSMPSMRNVPGWQRTKDAMGSAAETASRLTMGPKGHRYSFWTPIFWSLFGGFLSFLPLVLLYNFFTKSRDYAIYNMQLRNEGVSDAHCVARFTVKPMYLDQFVKAFNAVHSYLKRQPGYRGDKLLRGLPPSNEWLHICEFDSVESHNRAINTHEWYDLRSRLESLATKKGLLYAPVSETGGHGYTTGYATGAQSSSLPTATQTSTTTTVGTTGGTKL